MNSRLQALIDRGYSKEDVIRLSSFTEDDLNYAVIFAFKHLSEGCQKVLNPKTIYIGGQPGSGKTVLSMELKNMYKNYVEIGIDNYRMYHPNYLRIEKCIKKYWEGKHESVNSSPGNDIADFTHFFAGAMTDRLIELCSKADDRGLSFNILMEWGMREPYGPLKTMADLKKKGYDNIVLFLTTPGHLSYDACKLRADVMKNSKRIIRKVPKSFHDLCISTLPMSVDTIYESGFDMDIIDYMALVSRDGKTLWDNNYGDKPGKIYEEILLGKKNNTYNDENKAMIGNEKEMIGLEASKEKLNKIKDIVLLIDQSMLVSNSVKTKNS